MQWSHSREVVPVECKNTFVTDAQKVNFDHFSLYRVSFDPPEIRTPGLEVGQKKRFSCESMGNIFFKHFS